MSADEVVVEPATPDRRDDVVAVFGTRGDPPWCWCQHFLTTGQGCTTSAEANRHALEHQVTGRCGSRSAGVCRGAAGGVATALLRAARPFARAHGASVLEGHPAEVTLMDRRLPSATLCHGVLSSFLDAGSGGVGRTAPARPVVRGSPDDIAALGTRP